MNTTEQLTHYSEKKHHIPEWGRKALGLSIGFGMFEWLFLQVFRDNIGFHSLEGWIIGVSINIICVTLAVKYDQVFIDALYE